MKIKNILQYPQVSGQYTFIRTGFLVHALNLLSRSQYEVGSRFVQNAPTKKDNDMKFCL